MQFTEQDQTVMRDVLELASQGRTTTQPNPRVACILVKNGKQVGAGFHHSAGNLHGEREAIKAAGADARGATAYVNLEPCCHQGRTPPCTDGLIDAGVKKVIAAMRDPNPLVAGGGFEQLKLAGIEVASGLLEAEAHWLNRGFVMRMREKRPWVVIKSAATLDGRTAAFDGESKWITGAEARVEVQNLRASCSAVLTGIGTVLADDPQMNVRLEGAARQPLRVILDSQLRLPLEAKIIGDGEGVLVFTNSSNEEKSSALLELGVEVIHQSKDDSSGLNIAKVVKELARWQCNEVLVEAGQTLCGAFINANLADELVLYYGGSVIGDQGKAMFASGEPIEFGQRPEFRVYATKMVGEDVRINTFKQASVDLLAGIS